MWELQTSSEASDLKRDEERRFALLALRSSLTQPAEKNQKNKQINKNEEISAAFYLSAS